MDSIRPEIIWLIAGILLMLMEFVIPGVILVFFGAGAVLTGILVWLGALESLAAQLVCFGLSSLVLLFTLRRYMSRAFRGRVSCSRAYDDKEEFRGKTARVSHRIIPGSTEGRIDFNGTEWKATSAEIIDEGTLVEITAKENISYTVQPFEGSGDT
ncbi:MAG: NfeD family protein [Candidatus Eisenbacteria sp.]|nr:NfeD family protein [Candidatus Eisenbacteria bacterium]